MSKKVKLRAKYRTLKRGLTTKIHLASSSAEFALAFHLSPGNNHDAPVGRTLNKNIVSYDNHSLLMDHAYEDEATRQAALDSGFIPVVLSIAIHKNILTLDNGGKIEIGDDENAKYRSTRIDGKGI